MTGFLYLLALIAVPWLVLWSIRDPSRPTPIWWPFDMKGDKVPPPLVRERGLDADQSLRPGAGASWRDRSTTSRRRPVAPDGRG